MEGFKKIVIACSMEEDAMKSFEKAREYPWSKESEFHFVHVFKVQFLLNEFTPYVYPDEEQKGTIKDYVLENLKTFKHKIFPPEKEMKTFEVCLFDSNPKRKFLDYLSEIGADMVVVSAREKHGMAGLFTSSFTDYMMKFAHCDLLVLRPLPSEEKDVSSSEY